MTTTEPAYKQQQRIEQIQKLRKRNIGPSFDYTNALCEAIDFLLSLVKEREALARELALIVDVGTCDDLGTALSKLHKIQHVAATSMRSACVEKVKEMRDRQNPDSNDPFVNGIIGACNKLLSDLESLTLQGQEAKQ